MQVFSQSATDPGFVQDPYPFYDRLRAAGDLIRWDDFGMVCATSHDAVQGFLKDRRFGREIPADLAPPIPARLAPFYDLEAHSMLQLEPPRHTALRKQVLRAFTSRRIAGMGPEIAALANRLIDGFPQEAGFDLLEAFARPLPVIVIARLLGVPETMADQLLVWSNAMVSMYQARRSPEIEAAAVAAASDFTAYLRDVLAAKAAAPGDDLLSELLAARASGGLSEAELIATAILLLNAGHEATVHTIGNAVRAVLTHGGRAAFLDDDTADRAVEEAMRFDPPLHLFTRIAYQDMTVLGHEFRRGEQVGCLLASANRDTAIWPDAARFDPARPIRTNSALGGGIHFCVGAPLARLELKLGLKALFSRCPGLALAGEPQMADVYHFHGLRALRVTL